MTEPSFASDYAAEITEPSYLELQDLAMWSKHRGPYLYVIGGWACWHYHQGLGSRDIDVILHDAQSVTKFMYDYYKEHGFQTYGGLLSKRYRKPLKVGGNTVYIDIDAASFEDSQPFKEDQAKTLSYSLLADNHIQWDLGSASVFVPTPELLLLQKIKAYRDRSWDLRFKATNAVDVAWLRGKLWKDAYDIRRISGESISWNKLESFSGRQGLEEFVNETLDHVGP